MMTSADKVDDTAPLVEIPNDTSAATAGVEEGGASGADGNTEDQGSLIIPTGTGEDGIAKKRATQRQKSPSDGLSPAAGNKKRLVKKEKEAEDAQAIFIKYAALFLLVAQMVGLVLLMRYSRTHRDPDQPLYLASTAVFIMEVMKLVLCLMVIAYQTGSTSAFCKEMHFHTIQSPMEILKLCVPSLLYTVQNNLLYLALTNLDAATYQVCYQLKILTTALFSAILLQRTFSFTKWSSLVILTIGVAIVQVSGSGDHHSHSHSHAHEGGGVEHEEAALMAAEESQNRFIGLVAVLCAACTSGFSGVYFERILKKSQTSLWIRNVQMGMPSVIIAYITVYIKDGQAVQEHGFLGGYSNIVWTVVTVQAVGGLIVATVVKYADNVLKVFATSFSIVISCIISAFLFDFVPTWTFMLGASLVVAATVMYSSPEKPPRRRKTQLPMTHKPRK